MSSALEKTAQAVHRWPDRFIAYAGIDPSQQTVADLDSQIDLLNRPTGLELYPTN